MKTEEALYDGDSKTEDCASKMTIVKKGHLQKYDFSFEGGNLSDEQFDPAIPTFLTVLFLIFLNVATSSAWPAELVDL